MSGDPSNMANFTENSYNLTTSGSWCVKNNSIYTNPKAKFNYFNKQCGDPFTYYSYWYRRFPNQTSYLNCYNLPYRDPMLDNKWGYVKFGASNSKCAPLPNYHYNVVDRGFKYYDTKINPTKKNVIHV